MKPWNKKRNIEVVTPKGKRKFPDVATAAKALNVSETNIRDHLKGKIQIIGSPRGPKPKTSDRGASRLPKTEAKRRGPNKKSLADVLIFNRERKSWSSPTSRLELAKFLLDIGENR